MLKQSSNVSTLRDTVFVLPGETSNIKARVALLLLHCLRMNDTIAQGEKRDYRRNHSIGFSPLMKHSLGVIRHYIVG
jgi:hypothetical protein